MLTDIFNLFDLYAYLGTSCEGSQEGTLWPGGESHTYANVLPV